MTVAHNSWRRNAKAARAAALANLGLGLLEMYRHPPKRGTLFGVDFHMWTDFGVMDERLARSIFDMLMEKHAGSAWGLYVSLEKDAAEYWFRLLDGKLELLPKNKRHPKVALVRPSEPGPLPAGNPTLRQS